jgi:hypothetical protein
MPATIIRGIYKMTQLFLDGKAYQLPSLAAEKIKQYLGVIGAEEIGVCTSREIPEERMRVFDMIDEERRYQNLNLSNTDYQDFLWEEMDWIGFIEHYVNEAKKLPFLTGINSHLKLDLHRMACIRKIGALAVAAMENNETPTREEEQAGL